MDISGLKVVDTRKKLVLKITEKDCSLGAVKDAAACAAARALCRRPGIEEARVHIGRTYVKTGGKWIRYLTPPALRSEIIAFDRGGSFSPGEYTLLPIQGVARFDAPKRKNYARTGKRKIVHAKHHVVTGVRERGANR